MSPDVSANIKTIRKTKDNTAWMLTIEIGYVDDLKEVQKIIWAVNAALVKYSGQTTLDASAQKRAK